MKNTITIVLTIICLVFAYFTFFGNGNTEYKKKLSELDAANKILELQRDSLNNDITQLKTEYTKLNVKDSILSVTIQNQDNEIAKDIAIAKKSQAALNNIKHTLEQTRHQIDSVKAHPANRTGNDLLNSLKIKTSN